MSLPACPAVVGDHGRTSPTRPDRGSGVLARFRRSLKYQRRSSRFRRRLVHCMTRIRCQNDRCRGTASSDDGCHDLRRARERSVLGRLKGRLRHARRSVQMPVPAMQDAAQGVLALGWRRGAGLPAPHANRLWSHGVGHDERPHKAPRANRERRAS
jgi:hypothetical protein